jgi:hypothetical protein
MKLRLLLAFVGLAISFETNAGEKCGWAAAENRS